MNVVRFKKFIPTAVQLRAARSLLGMTLTQAGALINRSNHAISKHERGDRLLAVDKQEELHAKYVDLHIDFRPDGYVGGIAKAGE